MLLKHLNLYHFKNYEQLQLDFRERLQGISGLNGSGKTNMLEAIAFLAYGKSVGKAQDKELVRHGGEGFRILAMFEDEQGEALKVEFRFKPGSKSAKQIFHNDVECEKLAEHLGRIPLVYAHPGDHILVDAYSQDRRRFVDRCISQADRDYLHALMRYRRLLKQRNSLLKQYKMRVEKRLLDTYTEPMQKEAQLITARRESFCQQIQPHFEKAHQNLCQSREEPSLIYQNNMGERDLGQLFEEDLEKDMILGRTNSGPHRDDLVFQLNGHALKLEGSQGQKKSFVLALRLAEHAWLKQSLAKTPILLLDDIYDKLDRDRAAALFEILSDPGMGQVFLTDTRAERLKEPFETHFAAVELWKIEEGRASALMD